MILTEIKLNKTDSLKRMVALLTVFLLVLFQLRVSVLATAVKAPPTTVTASFYVSNTGNDADPGTLSQPWATLSHAAQVINGLGSGGHYEINVMSNLDSQAFARFYGNSVTIRSYNGSFTVTRQTGFALGYDTVRSGGYNPAMIEIGNTTPGSTEIYLILEDITFDDLARHEGTDFSYAGNTSTVQDGIIASYDWASTIILREGAVLQNYGGMTAVRITEGATLIMEAGSLITDTMTPTQLAQRGTTGTNPTSIGNGNFFAHGEAAVSAVNANFNMKAGSKITNIFNNHGVISTGKVRLIINGEISDLRGYAAFDPSFNTQGRGCKNAVYISGTTYEWNSANPGPAIIGADALIINNRIKSGAVYISDSTVTLKIYGKIANNTALAGITTQGSTVLNAGTNGGGLYIQSGAVAYLEDGGQISNNTVTDFAYGGGVSVQQGSDAHPSTLIMNGGTISNNSAPNGRDITVNKSAASFIMNGGLITNSAGDANTVILIGVRDMQSNGTITLNGGTISAVSVNLRDTAAVSVMGFTASGTGPATTPNTYYASITQRHIKVTSGITLGNNAITMKSLTGKTTSRTLGSLSYITNDCRDYRVTPLTRDFEIGFANRATYSDVRAALPTGWHLPTDDAYVVALWLHKAGLMEFSMPTPPTGTALTGYRNTTAVYFAAVEEVDANGAKIAGAPVKFYPVSLAGSTLTFEIPMDIYRNGAAVVLCQGTDIYGELEFKAPAEIVYHNDASPYQIPYSGIYEIPSGLISELVTNGDDASHTAVTLRIQPDNRVAVSGTDFVLNSDVFEVTGPPTWNNITHELEVALKLKSGWNTTGNLKTTFTFSGMMPAADFTAGDFLTLSGNIILAGSNSGNNYYIPGNITRTLMTVKYGSVHISNTTTGTAADLNKEFHFRVDFSDGGTYDGISSGYTFTLKHGEDLLINNIINGVICTITETDANTDGYTTTVNGLREREVIGEETLEYNFDNHKDITEDPQEEETPDIPDTGEVAPAMAWLIMIISWLAIFFEQKKQKNS